MIVSRTFGNKPLFFLSFSLFIICLALVWQKAPVVLALNKVLLGFFTSWYSVTAKSIAIFVSAFGDKFVYTNALLTFTGLLAMLRRWDAVFFVSLLTWPLFWLCDYLKAHLPSLRPDWMLVSHLNDQLSYSFPSRHVAALSIIGIALVYFASPKARQMVLMTVCVFLGAMCWARLYLTAHWMTDVLGALLLSGTWALLISGFLKPKEAIPTFIYPLVLAVWVVSASQQISSTYEKQMLAYTPFIQVAQQEKTTL